MSTAARPAIALGQLDRRSPARPATRGQRSADDHRWGLNRGPRTGDSGLDPLGTDAQGQNTIVKTSQRHVASSRNRGRHYVSACALCSVSRELRAPCAPCHASDAAVRRRLTPLTLYFSMKQKLRGKWSSTIICNSAAMIRHVHMAPDQNNSQLTPTTVRQLSS